MPKYIKDIIPRFKFHQRINQIIDIIFSNNPIYLYEIFYEIQYFYIIFIIFIRESNV